MRTTLAGWFKKSPYHPEGWYGALGLAILAYIWTLWILIFLPPLFWFFRIPHVYAMQGPVSPLEGRVLSIGGEVMTLVCAPYPLGFKSPIAGVVREAYEGCWVVDGEGCVCTCTYERRWPWYLNFYKGRGSRVECGETVGCAVFWLSCQVKLATKRRMRWTVQKGQKVRAGLFLGSPDLS